MSFVSDEDWGYIADYPMFPGDIMKCRQDAWWLAKILRAKYALAGQDLTGCLDSGLL